MKVMLKPEEIGKKLNPQTACPMAEQGYLLTFEGREFNRRMLGGSGVLNTPLPITTDATQRLKYEITTCCLRFVLQFRLLCVFVPE